MIVHFGFFCWGRSYIGADFSGTPIARNLASVSTTCTEDEEAAIADNLSTLQTELNGAARKVNDNDGGVRGKSAACAIYFGPSR